MKQATRRKLNGHYMNPKCVGERNAAILGALSDAYQMSQALIDSGYTLISINTNGGKPIVEVDYPRQFAGNGFVRSRSDAGTLFEAPFGNGAVQWWKA